jgi:hypothetical protein
MPKFGMAHIYEGAAGMEILAALWFISSLLAAGFLAKSKGRSVLGWCLLAVFIGWIAVIILAFLRNLRA